MLLKGREDLGHIPADQLATTLQERRGVIQEYLETARELRDTIKEFENQFDMQTEDMVESVRSGSRQETLEISKWMTAYERYRRISADWPTLATAQVDHS